MSDELTALRAHWNCCPKTIAISAECTCIPPFAREEMAALRAGVASLEESRRLLKLEVERLQTLAGGAMTELSRREADTKP